jgi:hypothetical protein
MRSLLLSLIILISPFIFAGDVTRIRAEREEGGAILTQHGTAFFLEGYVVTASHVVDKGDLFVERKEGWIRCEIVYKNENSDLAVLKTSVPTTPLKKFKELTGCFASIQSTPIRVYDVKMKTDKLALILGFNHGGSGGPIYKDGKFVGMCVSMLGEDTIFIPAFDIEAIVEKVKTEVK